MLAHAAGRGRVTGAAALLLAALSAQGAHAQIVERESPEERAAREAQEQAERETEETVSRAAEEERARADEVAQRVNAQQWRVDPRGGRRPQSRRGVSRPPAIPFHVRGHVTEGTVEAGYRIIVHVTHGLGEPVLAGGITLELQCEEGRQRNALNLAGSVPARGTISLLAEEPACTGSPPPRSVTAAIPVEGGPTLEVTGEVEDHREGHVTPPEPRPAKRIPLTDVQRVAALRAYAIRVGDAVQTGIINTTDLPVVVKLADANVRCEDGRAFNVRLPGGLINPGAHGEVTTTPAPCAGLLTIQLFDVVGGAEARAKEEAYDRYVDAYRDDVAQRVVAVGLMMLISVGAGFLLPVGMISASGGTGGMSWFALVMLIAFPFVPPALAAALIGLGGWRGNKVIGRRVPILPVVLASSAALGAAYGMTLFLAGLHVLLMATAFIVGGYVPAVAALVAEGLVTWALVGFVGVFVAAWVNMLVGAVGAGMAGGLVSAFMGRPRVPGEVEEFPLVRVEDPVFPDEQSSLAAP